MTDFELKRKQSVDALNIDVIEYEHPTTRARHIHIKPLIPFSGENVFLMGFKTIPQDDTGVAHILEHTVLCGSEHFPVAAPFFGMTRRSVCTFMNALTGQDWTAYPFASQNKKDFDNLLEVYLDVFFALIRKESFQQEGWRYAIETSGSGEETLVQKGVVLNEMKGAMNSPIREVYHNLSKELWAGTTYEFNSGGAPMKISDLSHERLKQFFDIFYHPSNAVFMTYGEIDVEEIQQKINDKVLSRFEYKDIGKSLQVLTGAERLCERDTVLFKGKKEVRGEYFSPSVVEGGSNAVMLSWMGEHDATLEKKVEASLVFELIMGNSASPLKKILEKSAVGVPSLLCGVETSKPRLAWTLGFENVRDSKVEEALAVVRNGLESIAKEGLDEEMLDCIAASFKMKNKEISSGTPYGLRLMLDTISEALNEEWVGDQLDIVHVIDKMVKKLKEPGYFKKYVLDNILENPNELTYIASANPELENTRKAQETQKLSDLFQSMSSEEKDKIKAENAALEKMQTEVGDMSVLPKFHVNDWKVTERVPAIKTEKVHETIVKEVMVPTNGLTYISAGVYTPSFKTKEEKVVLALYQYLLGKVGTKSLDYTVVQQRFNHAQVSDFSIRMVSEDLWGTSTSNDHLQWSFQTTNEFSETALKTVTEYWRDVDFSDENRIAYLLNSYYQKLVQNLNMLSDSIVRQEALSHFDGSVFRNSASPVEILEVLKGLVQKIALNQDWGDLRMQLQDLHNSVKGEWKYWTRISNDISKPLDIPSKATLHKEVGDVPVFDGAMKTAFLSATQSNSVFVAWRAPKGWEQDSAVFQVMANYLSQDVHEKLREKGGAYGAKCEFSSGAFMVYSSRDPRCLESVSDIREVVRHFLQSPVDAERLENAIISALKAYLEPTVPKIAGLQALNRNRVVMPDGFTIEMQNKIKSVTASDLKKVAEKWLSKEPVISVFAGAGLKEALHEYKIIEMNKKEPLEKMAPEVKSAVVPRKESGGAVVKSGVKRNGL